MNVFLKWITIVLGSTIVWATITKSSFSCFWVMPSFIVCMSCCRRSSISSRIGHMTPWHFPMESKSDILFQWSLSRVWNRLNTFFWSFLAGFWKSWFLLGFDYESQVFENPFFENEGSFFIRNLKIRTVIYPDLENQVILKIQVLKIRISKIKLFWKFRFWKSSFLKNRISKIKLSWNFRFWKSSFFENPDFENQVILKIHISINKFFIRITKIKVFWEILLKKQYSIQNMFGNSFLFSDSMSFFCSSSVGCSPFRCYPCLATISTWSRKIVQP